MKTPGWVTKTSITMDFRRECRLNNRLVGSEQMEGRWRPGGHGW